VKFIRNIWYCAGWSEEFTRTPLAKMFLNEPVVMFRSVKGTPIALANLCPHRLVPLSMGRLIGDVLECGYHGLQFDTSGACVHNPHQSGAIPRAAQVKAYPVAERHGLVWIWMGNASLADEDLIPDYSNISDTENMREVHGTLRLEANYLLVLDNLSDLSHAAILHPNLQSRELTKADYKVLEEGERLWIKQFAPAMEVPNVWRQVKGIADRLDHWQEVRFDPPGCLVTYLWFSTPGTPRENGYLVYAPNIITPETDDTTHYFWAIVRNFNLDDENLSASFRSGAQAAFEAEDKPMLEAQQRYLGQKDLMEMGPVLLPNDSGSARARRIVDRRIKIEKEA